MTAKDALSERYQDLLSIYLKAKNETTLYKGQQFSRKLLKQQISPEDLVSLHIQVLDEIFPDMSNEMRDSFDFLLEAMIGYGFAYREHQSLRDKQQQLESEIDVAASMQQTLLLSDVPQFDELDIGVVSVPARKMNGDYFNFVKNGNSLSVAVADIIGKGIPAALCMSMIKYAMDSLPEEQMKPHLLLENLNRVVEQNVNSNMFITMFHGVYEPEKHMFYYAGAGHEPGFIYNAQEDRFDDLIAKGLVLGVSRSTTYHPYEREIQIGDMVILLSDGVTECRTSKGFIEREEIVTLIRKYMDLPAQQIVENVFQELERIQEFELRDDFTLIILKRMV